MQNEASLAFVADDCTRVRTNPAMYIGGVDSYGLFTLLKELVHNAGDEARAGRNTYVGVAIQSALTSSPRFCVIDRGGGIPVGWNAATNESWLATLFTRLHSSGKFDQGKGKAYEASIGTHGVGASATCFMSKDMQISTFRDGRWYSMGFVDGRAATPLTPDARIPAAENLDRGTAISYAPDMSLFDPGVIIDVDYVKDWLKTEAYLTPGLQVQLFLIDVNQVFTWYSQGGLVEYVTEVIGAKDESAITQMFTINTPDINAAFRFGVFDASPSLHTFVNGARTINHGKHLQAFLTALMTVLSEKTKDTLEARDIAASLALALNLKMARPRFKSQTKEELVSREPMDLVTSIIEALRSCLNASAISSVLSLASKFKEARERAKLSKDIVSKIRSVSLATAGLVDCSSTNPHERELFIIEGDSAGGTARAARNPKTQIILPLRGKPKNALRSPVEAVLGIDRSNKSDKRPTVQAEKLQAVLSAIGWTGSGGWTPSVSKVILLMDADDDGRHIEALLSGFFRMLAPEVFTAGLLHRAHTPLFRGRRRNQIVFADTKVEIEAQIGAGAEITRFKGLGELDAEDLARIAFNPATRRLVSITGLTDADDTAIVRMLMADQTEARAGLMHEDA